MTRYFTKNLHEKKTVPLLQAFGTRRILVLQGTCVPLSTVHSLGDKLVMTEY